MNFRALSLCSLPSIYLPARSVLGVSPNLMRHLKIDGRDIIDVRVLLLLQPEVVPANLDLDTLLRAEFEFRR